MADRTQSRTALATAYLRAAHQLLDAEPRVLEDPVVLSLLGSDAERRIRGDTARYQSGGARALRFQVAFRSRFAEDRLAAVVQRGVTQYVVLGAGLDTFALRQPPWARSLKIVEVDHEGTQSLKRSLMAKAGLSMPDNLIFACIDFERESLLDGLLRHALSPNEPTFFSWLGVTMYLNEPAIDSTLRSIAVFPTGSELVVTYLPPSKDSAAGSTRLSERVADLGEPFVSFFTPEAFEAKLLAAGFTQVDLLRPEDPRYADWRPNDLPTPAATGIAHARK